MFKSLYKILKTKNLLVQANDLVVEMLNEDLKLFRDSVKLLWTGKGVSLKEIRVGDHEINRHVREVRKKILTHIAFSGISGMENTLAILYIVVYIERIGDHTKDIAHLAVDYPGQFTAGNFEEQVKNFEKLLLERLERLISIFEIGDDIREKASVLTRTHPEANASYHEVVKRLLTEDNTEGLTCSQCAKLALYMRYLRRIEGHIFNIASAEVNPFHRIGFRKKEKNIQSETEG